MKIEELLEVIGAGSKVEWEISPDSELPDLVIVDLVVDGVELTFQAVNESSSGIIYDVSFFTYDENGNQNYDLLKIGFTFASKVLSTVMDILYTLIKRYDPDGFKFESHGKKRTSVYEKLIKRLEAYGYKENASSTKVRDTKYFLVTKEGRDANL